MTEGRLAARAAMITGAGDGIGEGMARRFAAEGAAVLVADIDEEKGEAVARARAMITGVVAACVEEFGSIDILVNNAYRGAGMSRIETKNDELFAASLNINLYAVKWSMEAAFPHMRQRGWGRVINIGSLNGVNAHMGSAEYNVGKEALRAYTRSAAREWAPYGICANIICPAAVSASYRKFQAMQPEVAKASAAVNPMGRMGDPEKDIGGVALFLASEDARYLTGNTLFVDGGAHINGVVWIPDYGPEE
jgi:NAD(P)-dependent dehydrogenase (short-subunit alcohol dehydrogenase family)